MQRTRVRTRLGKSAEKLKAADRVAPG